MNKLLRLLAFHFPQFHPIPENDQLWGKGFTEWTNVTRGVPLFRGHYQPHLPADLGFYDLRCPETRQAQADLARQYGIYGFVYYHYWLHGTRLLERPVNEILRLGEPDFPFCFCWANEHWTRKWDGREDYILVRQDYSEEDDRNQILWLCENVFPDKRYLRINGRPLFMVYRALRLPDPRRTTEIWREEALKLGIGELYLCRAETFPEEQGDPAQIGFDAAVEFQPDWKNLGTPLRTSRLHTVLRKLHLASRVYGEHRIYDYADVLERMLREETPPYKRFPGVTPRWDNSPRRKEGGVIFKNCTPELYEKWLSEVVKRFQPFSPEENLVFINAWNEWGEGNHLEPCQKWGLSYLEATRSALSVVQK